MSEPTYSLAHVSITYEQSIGRRYETLTIASEDDGGGHYLILKTEGWSMDAPQELADLMADFKRRVPEIFESTVNEEPSNP